MSDEVKIEEKVEAAEEPKKASQSRKKPVSPDPEFIPGLTDLPHIPLAPTQTRDGVELRPGHLEYNIDQAVQDLLVKQKEAEATIGGVNSTLRAMSKLRAVSTGSTQYEQYKVDRANERRIRAEQDKQKVALHEVLKSLDLV